MAELSSTPLSIQSLYNWYRQGKLIVNRRYQRKLVWTLEEKQKLIDSIMKQYPIPAVLVAEREVEKGTYEIIDGLQRIHAIMSFIEVSFSTLDSKFFNLEHFPTANGYHSQGKFKVESAVDSELLDSVFVSTILDYPMPMSVMRNVTEEQVNDVFDRINTYGHRLSEQERRQAGVQSQFTGLVRKLACKLRGDSSDEILDLTRMPQVSIDLPLSRHGYGVSADEVFWVKQGILRATDLRDSMDEQCIADITACVVGGSLIGRSKNALDLIYTLDSDEYNRVETCLTLYGKEKFEDEFEYCIDEIEKATGNEKLRNIIFETKSTNPFPALFTALIIAFHELLIVNKRKISNYEGIKCDLSNASRRIETGRGGASPEERRRNINAMKGIIEPHTVPVESLSHIYGHHTTIDINEILRRSEVELANYELKQGFLTLSPTKRKEDLKAVAKVINTICAIANNGRKTGKIIIGVADSEQDAKTASLIDGITPKLVGKKLVVGVHREAKFLGKTVQDYLSLWKARINDSELSENLKKDVLSNIDYHDYYGLGLIVISIPPQKRESYVGKKVYWRSLDSTMEVEDFRTHSDICSRF
ncbi:GmrSD restriction endonuclease domain-containing protein [Shewanella baltica]|uniref:GmrSD restriction endonuclease domain-containing protein n=1 Tax=Shewanella baltica TaxID=62322 RepID=UPI003D0556BA